MKEQGGQGGLTCAGQRGAWKRKVRLAAGAKESKHALQLFFMRWNHTWQLVIVTGTL